MKRKIMDANLSEHERLLTIQENYFDNLLKMGVVLQNSGQYQKAIEVYKKGIEKAEHAKTDFMGTMLSLLY